MASNTNFHVVEKCHTLYTLWGTIRLYFAEIKVSSLQPEYSYFHTPSQIGFVSIAGLEPACLEFLYYAILHPAS